MAILRPMAILQLGRSESHGPRVRGEIGLWMRAQGELKEMTLPEIARARGYHNTLPNTDNNAKHTVKHRRNTMSWPVIGLESKRAPLEPFKETWSMEQHKPCREQRGEMVSEESHHLHTTGG